MDKQTLPPRGPQSGEKTKWLRVSNPTNSLFLWIGRLHNEVVWEGGGGGGSPERHCPRRGVEESKQKDVILQASKGEGGQWTGSSK